MKQKLCELGLAILVVFALQIIDISEAKNDPRDCEVCISVIDRFMKTLPESGQRDIADIEKRFTKFCKDQKGRDHKVCYYLGAVENAPSRVLNLMSKPVSYFMPANKVCEKLKKADMEICNLRYEKQIDLANTNLKKLRVNELKKILAVWGEENACKGCMEKSDFIKEIEKLMPKYDPEAHKKRTQKTDL